MKNPATKGGVTFSENNYFETLRDKSKFFSDNANPPTFSYFETVTTKQSRSISVFDAFAIIQSGAIKDRILKVREAQTKEAREKLKRQLPSITVSGTFEGGHSKENLVSYSGLIQIDFDSITDLQIFKEKICRDKYTFACFISPSGTGLKVIVKINSQKHLESFYALQAYYKTAYQKDIDKKCSDVGRLMFLSYDENIFINSQSEKFFPMNEKIKADVENIIGKIETQKIDITGGYDEWLDSAFAFADEFGELGRDYFHRVSRFYPEYDLQKCNKQFDNCLKSGKEGITIKTFFQIAKDASIDIRSNNFKQNGKQKKEKSENKYGKFVIVEKYINEHYDLRFNEVSGDIEYKQKNENKYRQLNENNLYRELRINNISFSQSDLMAILRSDFVPTYNPFQNYFENLPAWDEKTDHIQKLCDYITVTDPKRLNTHFKKMLVRCVACALGYAFNKHLFLLMGRQHDGKTTFIRWLCPPKLESYYSENFSTDKDGLFRMSDNFIINLDELATLEKFEINKLKNMLSTHTVKGRRPYDRKDTKNIRRANFFGSTNKEEFLNDETGSVRWLCFIVSKIDFNYKNDNDIDAIWAQAYSLLKNNYKYELTAEEIVENEKANSVHQIRTMEMELIQKYFQPAKKGEDKAEALTATDVVRKLEEMGIKARLTIQKVGSALNMLGFKRGTERIEGIKHPKKVYYVKTIE